MLDHTDQEYANLHNNEIQFRTFYIRKMGFPCGLAGKESCGRPGFNPWVEKIPWRRERLPTPGFWPGEFHGLYSCKELDTTERLSLHIRKKSSTVSKDWKPTRRNWGSLFMRCTLTEGFPGGSDGKASACNAGDPGLIPGSGRSPGEGNGNPLQYSCLENPMDGEA